MCFSAQASFTAAAVLIVIGIFSYRRAQNAQLRLLATGPLAFGLQQALEGMLWVAMTPGTMRPISYFVGMYGFLFFANIFWPIWLPGVMHRLETNPVRKKIIFNCLIAGYIIAASAGTALCYFGATATTAAHHISYDWLTQPFAASTVPYVYIVGTLLYLGATVVPLFASSIARMWLLGLAVSIGYIVAFIFYRLAFGSVWCFFAAVASVLIYHIIGQENKRHTA